MIGEIGGSAEEEAAAFIQREAAKGRKKPMAGFIAGVTAPPGRQYGDMQVLLSQVAKAARTTRFEAMKLAGIAVADSPASLGTTLADVLSN